jgi:hypothetical protein
MFENKVLRRIFGAKRDRATGGWRKLHKEELHNLYSSPSIRIIRSRSMRWAGHVARMGEKRSAYEAGNRSKSDKLFSMKNSVLMRYYVVPFVRTGVSEESIALIIRLNRISELGTTFGVTCN